MTDIEDEVAKVAEIMKRLDPVITKFLTNTVKDHGPNVSVSVGINIATSMIATSLMLLHEKGADVDAFMEVVLKEIRHKYDHLYAAASVNGVISAATISAGYNTCTPLH